jgi:hypothetical protein
MFATDASGGSSMNIRGQPDHGGFGAVVAEMNSQHLDDIFRNGGTSGFTVPRLGDLAGVPRPDARLRATVPFSKLHSDITTQDRWHVLFQGMWKYDDHITIKEARTVVKLLNMITKNGVYDALMVSLQDNMPTAAAMKKGRSSVLAFNRILRMRAGVSLPYKIRSLMPWIESKRQPADECSRDY